MIRLKTLHKFSNMKRFSNSVMFFAAAVAMQAASPYVAEVYDYCPAPGQFVNSVPTYTEGMSRDEFMKEVRAQLVGDGTEARPGMLSLGAFGGYVVFGFDHPVVNVEGQYDFKVYGNAFVNTGSSTGSSCEPGIVMVSVDANGNGLPDDEWFELAGSEYGKTEVMMGFKITYYRPDDADVAVNEPEYVRWTSNDQSSPEVYVPKNMFHRQSYWPGWIDADELTFEGTRLPQNAYKNGNLWVLKPFDWGYVDNLPNDADPGFKIDWAVDSKGNRVNLAQIHFVKVYTAMNQALSTIGESSTEVTGAEDLHPDAIASVENVDAVGLLQVRCRDGLLTVTVSEKTEAMVFDVTGQVVASCGFESGTNNVDMTGAAPGIYILRTSQAVVKFVR